MKKEKILEYLFIGAVIAFIIIAIIMAIKPDLGRPPIRMDDTAPVPVAPVTPPATD